MAIESAQLLWLPSLNCIRGPREAYKHVDPDNDDRPDMIITNPQELRSSDDVPYKVIHIDVTVTSTLYGSSDCQLYGQLSVRCATTQGRMARIGYNKKINKYDKISVMLLLQILAKYLKFYLMLFRLPNPPV